jgi:putative tricarboxylic transport membrane protein
MNLFFCFIGVLIGTLVGILPGLGPVAAMSLLLPGTFHMTPVSATIMLAGIYYGAMYGGSTTSILVNIPGEAASVVTCLDGHQMALQGRAGPALGISAFGSFIAGTFSVIGLMLLAPPLASIAIQFGPPEYFSLMILGLVVLSYLASGSMYKALMMAALGLFLGAIGLDPMSGTQRFTFGVWELADGVGLVPVAMGLFGIAEILKDLETGIKREVSQIKVGGLLPSLQDWKDCRLPLVRGTLIGFFLGVLPGGGAVISSFVSYAVEKKFSRHPERFGHGAIEGVAGPEAANNAATGGGFIPLLTLGIPANAVMALLLGAWMVYGLPVGPLLLKNNPDLFWGFIVSMYIGNTILLILNLPLIGLWIKVLKVPYSLLFPLILIFCLIGSYSVNSAKGDMVIMLIFGVVGYLMKRYNYEAAPLVLALVLGPMMENALRQSMIMSRGSFSIFTTRPVSMGIMVVAFALLAAPFFSKFRSKIPQ